MVLSRKQLLLFVVLVAGYWFSRLFNLTLLPVFADEAIYIRWAQTITSEPGKYLFLPLLDGKPPLHMWLLTTFLPLFPTDPLLASRLLSVVVGFLNFGFIIAITRTLGGSLFAQGIAGLLYIILPFTVFHDRMGLIDTLLLFSILMAVYGLFHLHPKRRWPIIVAGVGFGLGLLAKTTALFFLPVILVKGLVDFKQQRKSYTWKQSLIVAGMGLAMFASLRVSSLFPFLFQRSGDFSYSPIEVIQAYGKPIFDNTWRVAGWMGVYLTWPLTLIGLATPLLLRQKRRQAFLLLLLGLLFITPLLIIGKAIVPRYFLPFVGFFIPAVAILIEVAFRKYRLLAIGAMLAVIFFSFSFLVPLLTNPGATPFIELDKTQYLTSWSSGHGIGEIRDFLIERTKYGRIVVATEGYFGTLPDGLLMYFINHPAIEYLEIFGVGQPITNLNPEFVKKAETATEAYIVVNEDRLKFRYEECCALVHYYPRPYNAPALLLLQYKKHE